MSLTILSSEDLAYHLSRSFVEEGADPGLMLPELKAVKDNSAGELHLRDTSTNIWCKHTSWCGLSGNYLSVHV